jgi:ParB family chromosome partitioning protein
MLREVKGLGAGAQPHLREAIASAPGMAPAEVVAAGRDPRFEGTAKVRGVLTIPRDRIMPDPAQPRKEFDELELKALARSLVRNTQLNPITVEWRAELGLYQIIAGERRWRAAGIADLPTLECKVLEGIAGDGQRRRLQLIENCQRTNLSTRELAWAYRDTMEMEGCDAKELAALISVSDSHVYKVLAVLELPGEVQEMVERKELSRSAAYEISQVDDADVQVDLARQAVAGKLSRDQVAQEARARRGGKSTRGRQARPDIWKWSQGGATVQVTGAPAAAGGIVLEDLLLAAVAELRQARKSADAA